MKRLSRLFVSIAVLASVWAASPAHADTFEPNDSVAQAAGPLVSGAATISFISSLTDLDYFYLDADLGPFTVTLTSIPPGTDYDLYVVDESNNVILSSESENNSPEEIQANVTGSGRFYVLVLPFTGFSDSDSYVLTATFNPLTSNTAPTVTVTAPNGGESITANSTFNITWTASDAEDGGGVTVDLAFSSNGGASYAPIATGIANTGSFSWSVPASATSQGRIRATVHDSGGLTGEDQSNANFSIVPAAPIGNATLTVGNATVDAGSTISVSVNLNHDQPMAALQLTVLYDAARLTAQSVTKGARASALTLSQNLSAPGEARFTLHSDGGATVAAGNGAIAQIAFLAKPTASGTVPLTASGAVVSDAQARAMNLSTVNGAITVNAVTPQITLAVPGSITAPPGTAFDVPVTLTNNLAVAALQFALAFNSNTLTPVSVTAGARMSGMTLTTNTTLSGEVRLVFHHPSGGTLAQGSGTACTVRFQAKPAAPGNTTLGFTDVVASDADGNGMAVATQNGSVTGIRNVQLAAAVAAGGVRLTWTADADAGHAGFRVLRDDDAVPLHQGLLPPDTREFTDVTAGAGRSHAYWLEAVDRSGFIERFGPVVVQVPVAPLSAGVPFPNPSREGSTLRVEGLGPGADARILDASGRLVRRLETPSSGAGFLRWDGRLENGGEAPAGIYFFRMAAGDRLVTRRMVKLAR